MPEDIIKAQIALVEKELDTITDSSSSFVRNMMKYILSGGKLFRPRLVILSALALNTDVKAEKLIKTAVCVELIHCASLVHDDVIDSADTRRKKHTANFVWGNKASILAGDYILAKVFLLFSQVNDPEISALLVDTAAKMISSELTESMEDGNIKYWQENYDKIINDKTAVFVSTCTEAGAICANVDTQARACLKKYGTHLGTAFQITDDILDFFGDPQVTGKPCGGDLAEGKYTLPLLLALDMTDCKEKLLDLIYAGQKDIESVKEIIRSSGALEKAYERAKAQAESAIEALESLPKSEYKDALISLADLTVTRKY